VLVKEAMANGRLALDPPEPVAALAKSLDVGPDAVALAAALAQPWADTVLSGAAGTRQLAGNLAARTVAEVDLPDLAEPPADYWKHRSSLAWA
jgi:aryl-alcohol dehydrogenase-like predicted oxidoreductase